MVIVYCNKKLTCEALYQKLGNDGIYSIVISGLYTLDEKKFVKDEIKSGRVTVMISTGGSESIVNLSKVDAFINYDFP